MQEVIVKNKGSTKVRGGIKGLEALLGFIPDIKGFVKGWGQVVRKHGGERRIPMVKELSTIASVIISTSKCTL